MNTIQSDTVYTYVECGGENPDPLCAEHAGRGYPTLLHADTGEVCQVGFSSNIVDTLKQCTSK